MSQKADAFSETSGGFTDLSALAHNADMQRTSGNAITGWAAVLLLPIVLPIGLIAQLLPGKKTVDRTPEDVAGFIGDFLDGTGGAWDWDEFECVPITDPRLDAIRQKAVRVGPPNPNLEELRRLASEALTLSNG